MSKNKRYLAPDMKDPATMIESIKRVKQIIQQRSNFNKSVIMDKS